MFSKPLRANRLSGLNVVAYYKKQKGLLAFGEFRHIYHSFT
jgi:hypothetical protein